jgi:hypothetical protein
MSCARAWTCCLSRSRRSVSLANICGRSPSYDSPGIHSIQAADPETAPARTAARVIRMEDHLRTRCGSGPLKAPLGGRVWLRVEGRPIEPGRGYLRCSRQSHSARTLGPTTPSTLAHSGISVPPAVTWTPKTSRRRWSAATRDRKIAATSTAGFIARSLRSNCSLAVWRFPTHGHISAGVYLSQRGASTHRSIWPERRGRR